MKPTLKPNSPGKQIVDAFYEPPLFDRTFPSVGAPTVFIDEAHANFHTRTGRYGPFAKILCQDGFIVKSLRAPITSPMLLECSILVIANALSRHNIQNWSLPTPSAFTLEEIDCIYNWVAKGGALFLIADHMPFAGAATALAERFSFTFYNGFATDETGACGDFEFCRLNGTLCDHPITRGRSPHEYIDKILTFTGQAFAAGPDVAPLLILPSKSLILLPTTAWEFSTTTERRQATGLLQGAVKRVGQGKVAVFGEAAMFSAQISGPTRVPIGMNVPRAEQNAKFLLNIMHWLVGVLPD